VLATAEELERQSDELVAALARLSAFGDRIEALHTRAVELRARLAQIPDELTQLEAAEERAGARQRDAAGAVADAERVLAEAEAKARSETNEAIEAARRALAQRQRDLEAADELVALHAGQREALVVEEREARGEAAHLEQEARDLAAELASEPRVAQAASDPPRSGLDGVAEWADRAAAALLVARSGRETEHDRTLREAGELASSVLGEPVSGSVSTIRRRLEDELGS
jgi:colicin import membrane protein